MSYATSNSIHSRLPLGERYVLLVPVVAGVGALGGSALNFGGFNLSGFLWVIALVAGIGLLAVDRTLGRHQVQHFVAWPWLLFLSWVALSFMWLEEVGFKQVQEAVQLGMPVLVGIVASAFISQRAQLEQLVKACFWTVPLLAFLSCLWASGLVTHEEGAFFSIGIRPLSLTAVLFGGLSIAGVKRNAGWAWLGWFTCLAITVITGSRIASVAMLMLPLINPVNRGLLKKLFVIGIIGLVGVCVYLTPIFQERFFRDEAGGIEMITSGDFDSSGRFDVWPIVLEEALEKPWIGHGEGSVRDLVIQIWEDQTHPHNDYLRVGYELGAIGLVLFLGVIAWQMWNLSRWIRDTDGVVQQAFGGAWLGLAALLVIAYTDNPVVYNLYYMNPLFALMGAAYQVAREEDYELLEATRFVPRVR